MAARYLQGTLRGKYGDCIIKATQTRLPRAGIEPQIANATLAKPVPLPEGNYDLVVDGKCLHVRLGKWTFVVLENLTRDVKNGQLKLQAESRTRGKEFFSASGACVR
jgi:hypothetical protein